MRACCAQPPSGSATGNYLISQLMRLIFRQIILQWHLLLYELYPTTGVIIVCCALNILAGWIMCALLM